MRVYEVNPTVGGNKTDLNKVDINLHQDKSETEESESLSVFDFLSLVYMVYNFISSISMYAKSMILVVLMFAQTVPVKGKNYSGSDWDIDYYDAISDLGFGPENYYGGNSSASPQTDFYFPMSGFAVQLNSSRSNESGPPGYFVDKSARLLLDDENVSSWRVISVEAERFLTGRRSTVVIPSFYTLVCIVSMPLNICALLVFVRRIKPKNSSVIFMLNLACADLLFAMVLPLKIIYHFNGNNWIFGPAMCRLVTAAFFWNMYSSVLLIACISVDRLLAVVYPVSSLTWRSPRKAAVACVAMWVLSLAGSMHVLCTEQTVHLHQLNITTCHEVQASRVSKYHRIYFFTLCLLLFFLPLVITAVSYTRVIMTLSKAQPGVPDHDRKKKRAVVMTLTVLTMFVICFTPANCLFTVRLINRFAGGTENKNADSLYIVYLLCLCLGSLNCLMDPLIYYFGSSQFQKELCVMLRHQKPHSHCLKPKKLTSLTALKPKSKEGSKDNTPQVSSDSS